MLGNKKIADNDKLTGKIIKKMKEVPGWNAGTLTKLTFPKNNIKRLNITSKAASQLVISGINQKLNNLSYTAQGSKNMHLILQRAVRTRKLNILIL